MPGKTYEQKALVKRELELHIQEHGPKDYHLVYNRYPDIRRRTLERWVAEVRKKTPSAEQIEFAVREARVQTRKHLPAPPPPDSIARDGAEAVNNVDLLAKLGELYADAEQLRDFSLKERREGQARADIKIPGTFDTSIKRRLDLILTAIKAQERIYDLQRMQEFYRIIVDEIALESPDCKLRIMKRLAAVDAKHGMTIHAGEA